MEQTNEAREREKGENNIRKLLDTFRLFMNIPKHQYG